MKTRIADRVAQNKLKKFRIRDIFWGVRTQVLTGYMFMTSDGLKNIFDNPAGIRKIGKTAELHKDRLREMGKLESLFPISDVGEFGRETGHGSKVGQVSNSVV
jgi:hypothetical protein